MTATTTRAAETWARILAQPDGYPMGIAADWLQEHADHDGSPEAKAEACAAVEEVAQAHLDARLDAHRARRLLGEWLQWHGDRRGEGLRALAACGRVPNYEAAPLHRYHRGKPWSYWSQHYEPARSQLPSDWVDEFNRGELEVPALMVWGTRRAAEDAAALAFARLPADRRAQLLKGEV